MQKDLPPASPSVFSRQMEIAEELAGTVINLHDASGVTLEIPDLQLKQDQYLHHGPYCRFAKFHGQNKRCSENKARSIVRAARENAPFHGQCPFGVWEIARPIKHRETLLCVLYLGHFSGEKPLETIGDAIYEGPELQKVTRNQVRQLKRIGKLLEDNFFLIYEQWRAKGGCFGRDRNDGFYRNATEKFIESRYSENVRLGDLAKQLNLHPHHLGKVILRVFGESFLSLLKKRRLQQAKILLSFSELSITHIAYEIGFQDGNYFSTVFGTEIGISPKKYRGMKLKEQVSP